MMLLFSFVSRSRSCYYNEMMLLFSFISGSRSRGKCHRDVLHDVIVIDSFSQAVIIGRNFSFVRNRGTKMTFARMLELFFSNDAKELFFSNNTVKDDGVCHVTVVVWIKSRPAVSAVARWSWAASFCSWNVGSCRVWV